MAYFKSCPDCGANLDPGERCDCTGAKYRRLTPENRALVNRRIKALLGEQRKAASVLAHRDGSMVEQVGPGSTSILH